MCADLVVALVAVAGSVQGWLLVRMLVVVAVVEAVCWRVGVEVGFWGWLASGAAVVVFPVP